MLYAVPPSAVDLDKCWFYHKVDLPGYGEVGGDWDLRDCMDAYLGNYNFRGKRVLDIGTASGALTFAMEERGAEVVSFDIDDGAKWNVVDHYKVRSQMPEIRSGMRWTLERLKNGYWLSHRALGSRARVHYGDIYNMNPELGQFDALYYGMIVGHLRDPFLALEQGASLCRETMIVSSMFEVNDTPRMSLYASPANYSNNAIKSWWHMTTGMMKHMLGILGFETIDVVISHPKVRAAGFEATTPECQTIVARKISV